MVLAVGLVWLLAASAVAVVIGRAIRVADAHSVPGDPWDRLLVDCSRDLDPTQAAGGSRRLPRLA
jgi:hypothetical protein